MRGSALSGRVTPAATITAITFAIAVALLAGCSVSSDVSRALGALCEDSDECDDRCLTGARYPDGICSLSCDDDGDCPDGASCVDRDGGVCLFSCTDRTECAFLGVDWRCRGQPKRGTGGGGEVMVCLGPG